MASLAVEQQRGMNVTYKGIRVGEYIVDFLVEDPVLIELKTVRALDRASSRAMHQLPPGDRKTHVPAARSAAKIAVTSITGRFPAQALQRTRQSKLEHT